MFVMGRGRLARSAALAAVFAALLACCKTDPSSASIGVPQCDEYLSKRTRCIDKMNPAAATDARTALAAQVKALSQASATPTGKAGLAATCEQLVRGLATDGRCN
jgi:hypothetical protein